MPTCREIYGEGPALGAEPIPSHMEDFGWYLNWSHTNLEDVMMNPDPGSRMPWLSFAFDEQYWIELEEAYSIDVRFNEAREIAAAAGGAKKSRPSPRSL